MYFWSCLFYDYFHKKNMIKNVYAVNYIEYFVVNKKRKKKHSGNMGTRLLLSPGLRMPP